MVKQKSIKDPDGGQSVDTCSLTCGQSPWEEGWTGMFPWTRPSMTRHGAWERVDYLYALQ
ncbi:MAG: hypothetical protein NPIRA04_18290 [Nitrospirales bacterium]|nr:MAG: hypothetical protein NPIRA04_18290 [Nitrospirales bacterium]